MGQDSTGLRTSNVRRFSISKAAKGVSTGLASAMIVAIGGLYLLAPTTEALAMNVQQHADTSNHREVIYGSVKTYQKVPIQGAEVIIYKNVNGRKDVLKILHDQANGTYRSVVILPKGPYFVEVIVILGGRTLTHTKKVFLTPGRDYKISARTTIHNVFSLLPVSSY